MSTPTELMLNAVQLQRIVQKHKQCDHPEDCETCGLLQMIKYWMDRHTEVKLEMERWVKRMKGLEGVLDSIHTMSRGISRAKET